MRPVQFGRGRRLRHNGPFMWKPGDLLRHRHNPELGLGRIAAVEPRSLVVEFPHRGVRLTLAGHSTALVAVDLSPGRRVRIPTGEEAAIEALLPDGRVRLVGGGEVATDDLWPLDVEGTLLERLAAGDVDPLEDFATRLESLHLAARRESKGLGPFLGGRIRLFPHQLHVAERATRAEPVRWLLADEVGLGKTVEACMILNRLVQARRVERCLVAAPETLTVQWLGELWRKHHQVFVLLDDKRLADVKRDFGPDFNPFDVHRRVVVAHEMLVDRPKLTEQAVAAGVDLLVVDEAHRLRRPRGHPGDPVWRAVAPIAEQGRHVLLLTAIPFEDDVHGFFRLLQLLRPDEFPDEEAFEARLARAEPLPPCTSSTRREDIGGLPPRVALPIDGDTTAWRTRLALEATIRAAPAPDALTARRKADRIRRALASGSALQAVLDREEADLRRLAAEADAEDPRVAWLAANAPQWKAAGQKSLVFVEHPETLEMLRTALSRQAQLATAAFHESLSAPRRDIEVAQFRGPDGPSLLISTECGGEGRNFEFCHRLVLFDLPWSPVVVEQRIGRLDRIGRRVPVEILFFRPPGGIGADVARVFEAIGLFREPLAGLEPELAPLEAALEGAALRADGTLSVAQFETLAGDAQAARTRIREAAYRELHRDRYRAEGAEAVLRRVPADLDDLNEEVVVSVAERLGFHVERQRGQRTFSIEFGNEALVDNLPGVPGGASFLGTFGRDEAVEDETLDFYAAGHPLVEGILAHLEESSSGRVAVLHVVIGQERGFGLLVLYKDGPEFEAVVIDEEGRERGSWAAAVTRRPLRTRRVPAERMRDPQWSAQIHRLGGFLDPARKPVALAALIVGA
jgi:ATP-dependent helicase HepA